MKLNPVFHPAVFGCRCALHSRRLFTGALLAGGLGATALARDGVVVDRQSSLAKLVPADQVEAAAAQQYKQMLMEAAQQRALAPATNPQVVRLTAIGH